ncbi:nitrate reductase [Labrys monachus]|uniref:Assimilatory nitrate reductase catalytic subunit n=1 Tax=Labrys monachus TaxID=217067 RepID=A0ABU0FL32_9HYPH|nr:nitrate reductase [Labrys monachus]MDQ0395319.1 assimilatory nitrate reductase catalytic subunit [Labrys monachus]
MDIGASPFHSAAPLAQAGVRTTCAYCGVGCGVIATPDGAGGAAIAGDAAHPANRGRLCVKGAALGETLATEGRLHYPAIHGVRTTWNRALDAVAEGLRRASEQHGPDAVAFYLSGQLLTEDYYVANKLMKGFIGSANVDTNSRLCMASTVAGHKRAFGADIVPNCYEDLDEADLVVLVGSNTAWCHPVLFQRIEQARAGRGCRVVAIDPRRTVTAGSADLHLAVAPGMDGVLFARLLVEIAERGALDRDFVARHTAGLDEALGNARRIAPDRAATAARCGVGEADLALFLDWWIATPRVVTCFSQGVNQSAQGTDKVNAILNVHLAAGRIGRPGSGPFSLTGQPNAMGGREVGGLANQLAAHMGFAPEEVDRVGRFWQAPRMAQGEGLKAVALFEAVERGEIKALWVLCTNPAASLPRADAMRSALKKLDFLAVSEISAHVDGLLDAATVVLPAAAWGEKDGTVTNSERRISRQRPFLAPPGEARPDWWQICEVGKRLGHRHAFDFRKPADIFREHAALSAFENDGTRLFDIGGLAEISDEAYDDLAPVQWPLPKGAIAGTPRLFGQGGFAHADGKARFVCPATPSLAAQPAGDYPLILNTGRVRDQWHTMSRTGLSPGLARHCPAPFVEVHPEDAGRFGLADGGFAVVSTPHGRVELRVVVTAGQRPGSIFAPIHWTEATAGRARVGALVHGVVDPVSGQPDSKAVPAAIRPWTVLAQGFIVARKRQPMPAWLSHARMAVVGGEVVSFASPRAPGPLHDLLSNWLDLWASPLNQRNPAAGLYRAASLLDHRLEVLLSTGPLADEAGLDWAIELLSRDRIDAATRRYILAGRAPGPPEDRGPQVCACFGVRQKAIEDCVRRGARSVEAVGKAVRAGTNCGSCRPEIRKLLEANLSAA